MKGFIESAENEAERLLAYVRRRVDSPEAADDIVQDAYLALCGRWSLQTPIRSAMGWLFRVAANKIVDRYRGREREPVSLTAQPAGADASDLWELSDARVAGPEEEAERRELREALEAAIDSLPEDQKEVFALTELAGVPYKDIAARTGVPVNTLLSRKRYAVLKLRAALRDRFGIEEE